MTGLLSANLTENGTITLGIVPFQATLETETNYEEVKSVLLPVDRYVVAAIFCCIMTAGLFGNGLVITAVALSKDLRSATYAFVVALAFSDLITMLNVPWSIVAMLSADGWPLPNWICSLAAFTMITCIGFSICTMACIAVNRLTLFTLSRETHDKIFTPTKTALIIFFTAVINVAAASPPILFQFGKLGYDKRFSSCTWDKSYPKTELFELFVLSIQYPIPLVVCIACYAKLYLIIREQTKTMLSNEGSLGSTNSTNLRKTLTRRQLEVTKSMFYILCTFLLCTVPFAVVMMMTTPGRIGPYAGSVLLLNSALNPLIYAVKLPHFKKEMKRVLMCKYSQSKGII